MEEFNYDLEDLKYAIEGSLILDGNHTVTALSEEASHTEGILSLQHCTSLRHLPERLTVGETLDFSYSGVEDLHKEMFVAEDIVGSNSKLRSIANLTIVQRNLVLSHCESLEEMPKSLVVNGNIVNPSGSLITKHGGTLKAIPILNDDYTSDSLLQKSHVPLDAVFMGNGYFVSYQNKLWRIRFSRNDFYVLEDLCFSWVDTVGECGVLYKGSDGRYILESLEQLPPEEFMRSWYGELLYGNQIY